MKTKENNSEMIGLCHIGMYAKNPALLAEFYRDVMGMQIVGGSDASHPLGPSTLARQPAPVCQGNAGIGKERSSAFAGFGSNW
jgi:catechol 2,3-dioxygenase-like lactoylglutathione lyase family enzyme